MMTQQESTLKNLNGGNDTEQQPNQQQENGIRIRAATAQDSQQLLPLIQELADFHNMSNGPKIGVKQLEADFRTGAMRALVAKSEHGEIAAYASYYLQPSLTISGGQLLHLEDLYICSKFRRQRLGTRLLRELANLAHTLGLPYIQWMVLRTNYGAIRFYHSLKGCVDLTDERPTNKAINWLLYDTDYERLISRAKQIPMKVLLDEPGQIDQGQAQRLAEQWQKFMTEEERKTGDKSTTIIDVQVLARLLHSGQMGVLCVHGKQLNANAGDGDRKKAQGQEGEPPIGMALFHRKSYSTWRGRFPELMRIHVAEGHRRQGVGTAIVAELVKIAKQMGATKIEGFAPEPSEARPSHLPFFKSLNALNLTDFEGWLLYRWDYTLNGLLNDASVEDKENKNGSSRSAKQG